MSARGAGSYTGAPGECKLCGGGRVPRPGLDLAYRCEGCGALSFGRPGERSWWELAGCRPDDQAAWRRFFGFPAPRPVLALRRLPAAAWAIAGHEAKLVVAAAACGHQRIALVQAGLTLAVLVQGGHAARSTAARLLTIAARDAGIPGDEAADILDEVLPPVPRRRPRRDGGS